MLAISIVIIALAFTMLRTFLPEINYYKDEIIVWVEDNYNIKIEVSDIYAQWQGSGPVISANNFVVKSDDNQIDLIHMDSFSVQINFFKTLFSNNLKTDNIELVGAKFNFALDDKFGLKLTLPDNDNQTDDSDIDDISQKILSTLFGQKNLTINQSEITLRTSKGNDFKYIVNRLLIRNVSDIHQITGNLIDAHAGELKLILEIFGPPSLSNSHVDFYLQGKNINLAKLPFFENKSNEFIQPGIFNGEIWSHWRDGYWQSALGNLEINALKINDLEINKPHRFGDKQPSQKINFNSITSQFKWKAKNNQSGVLYLSEILAEENGNKESFPEVFLFFEQKENLNLQWDVISYDIELQNYSKYIDWFNSKQKKHDNGFVSSNVELEFNSIGVRLIKENKLWQPIASSINFTNLSHNRLLGLPSVKGISGQMTFSNKEGFVHLKSEEAQLDLKSLFRKPLNIDSIDLTLFWQTKENDTLNLIVNSALIKNKDFTLNAKGRYFVQDKQPILSLYTELSHVNLSNKSLYLPTGVMSENLVSYLDNGIISGELSMVKAVVHGPLNSYPFNNLDGLFSIDGTLKNTTYQYLQGWPVIKDLSAQLLFEGKGMDITAFKGAAMNNQIQSARATIKDMSAPQTLLELDLDLVSQDNSGRLFLNKTPLNSIAQTLDIINIKGFTQTVIKLSTDLSSDTPQVKIDGKVLLGKKEANISLAGMNFTDLNGDVLFDEVGVKKSSVTAKYYDERLNVDLLPKGNKNDFLINVKGKIKASALEDFMDKKWVDLFTGTSQFKTTVRINNSATKIKFYSDLKGIKFNLYDQLVKTSKEIKPININLDIKKDIEIGIHWEELNGRWKLKKNKGTSDFIGGVFYYNKDESLPLEILPKLTVKASFDQFDIVKHLPNKSQNENLNLPEIDLNLAINQLLNPMVEISNVNLQLHHEPNKGTVVSVKSNLGDVGLKIVENEPLQFNLDKFKLALKKSYIEKLKTKSQENTSETFLDDPQQWPELTFQCGDCELFSQKFGKITANLTKQKSGLQLLGLVQDGKYHEFAFNLDWVKNTTNLKPEIKDYSSLEFKLISGNVTGLMKRWDYDLGIEESNGQFSGKLSWFNKPWNAELKELFGAANFSLDEGYLSEVSDAKARIFSIFTLQSLSKRLLLDFRDIYKQGFFYEKINGDIKIKNGVVSSNNLIVDGNAAKVQINGSVDLENKTIEQYALVTPKLTSSLPLLVGWAAEPVTGFIVYLLNKIMEPAIDVVTQIEYRIHGNLDDIQVDETSKKKSTIKYQEDKTIKQ